MTLLERYVLPLLIGCLGGVIGFLGSLFLQKRQHRREDQEKALKEEAERRAWLRAMEPNEVQQDILDLCLRIGEERFACMFGSGMARINDRPVGSWVGSVVQTQLRTLDTKGFVEILDDQDLCIVFRLTDLGRSFRDLWPRAT